MAATGLNPINWMAATTANDWLGLPELSLESLYEKLHDVSESRITHRTRHPRG